MIYPLVHDEELEEDPVLDDGWLLGDYDYDDDADSVINMVVGNCHGEMDF
jgi:hypothetical protein